MKKLYCFILGLCCAACGAQEEPTGTAPILDGAQVRTEVVAALNEWGIQEPGGLWKAGSMCVIADRMNVENLYRVDLENQQREGLYPRVRTRGGKPTLLGSLTSNGKGGWTVFNFNTGELKQQGRMTRSGEENTVNLPTTEKALWAVQAGEYVLSTGLYTQGRYQLYSPTKEEARYFIDYPEHPTYKELKPLTQAVLYASAVLRVRPDGKAFVCGDMYSGVLDVCRIDEGEISLVKRLIYHYPYVKIRENRACPSVVYKQENQFGFTDICVTDEGIYALYSGRTYRMGSETFQHCNTLIELDWNGEVRNNYSIDAALTQIAYDEQENAFYGIEGGSEAKLLRLKIEKK